jgi:hypothetical protein
VIGSLHSLDWSRLTQLVKRAPPDNIRTGYDYIYRPRRFPRRGVDFDSAGWIPEARVGFTKIHEDLTRAGVKCPSDGSDRRYPDGICRMSSVIDGAVGRDILVYCGQEAPVVFLKVFIIKTSHLLSTLGCTRRKLTNSPRRC